MGQRHFLQMDRSLAGRAKVNEHRAAVLAQVDILRLDVEMQHLGLMHRVQAIENRDKHLQQGLLLQTRSVAFEIIRETLSLLIFHDHVGSPIVLEETQDADDIGVLEAGQGPRLLHEILEADLIVAHRLTGGIRQHLGLAFPVGNLVREILLDRHLGAQRRVVREISDSEAAMAQNRFNSVFSQPVTGPEGAFMECAHATSP